MPRHVVFLAERVGFEPTVRCRITSFQDWLLKPLGHLSNKGNYIIFAVKSQGAFLKSQGAFLKQTLDKCYLMC